MLALLARLTPLVMALLVIAAAASAQQSEVQRCLSVSPRSDPAIAEYCQGIFAANATNGPQNQAAAFQHYLKAAQMGYAEAQAVVGVAYQQGWQVQPNASLAAQWYEKAAAQGHAGAELNLGEMYLKGNGVSRDAAKGRQLIATAAAQGFAPAQRELALIDSGGPKPLAGADLWNQGVALYNSGNHTGAARLVLQAAQAGHPTATYEMGYLYENGDGVPKDLAQAAQWYQKGAAMGDAASESVLGLFYEEGQQVPDDWIEAAKWYQKSAAQNNASGQSRLGRAYEYGVGVPLDLDAAAGWYDKAAAQGDGKAAYFAKYIRDNHGFDRSSYSDEEQAIMGPYMMQPWMLHPPPIGRVFRNTQERLNYFRAWASNAAAYEACMARHANAMPGTQFTCPAPVPPG
jgi:TPR repeat protein